MARQVLGGLTTLNLSTNLDPMFAELYGSYATGSPNSIYAPNFYATTRIGIGNTSPTTQLDITAAPAAGSTMGVRVNDTTAALSISLLRTGSGFLFAGVGGNEAWLYTESGPISIGPSASGTIKFVNNGALRASISSTGVFTPGADNTQTLGSGALRWSVVYAGTGAINTSDAREKTQVKQLTADELAAAKQIAREFGTYQFLAALEEKGDAARLHSGTTVQRVIQIMESFGLDPMRYAFVCYDEWDAELDADGNETRAAGNRYSFRPDELLMFIARGMAARQDEL
jgi:hypothetical protein